MEAQRDLNFQPDDRVQVTSGPFKDIVGKVTEVDTERRKAKVTISFFGRPTPIEVTWAQIKKVSLRG